MSCIPRSRLAAVLVPALLVLSLTALSAAPLAPGRLDAARQDLPLPGWLAGTRGEIVATAAAGLAAGLTNPTRLDLLPAWISSDYMPDRSQTDHIWYPPESLFVYGGVLTDSAAPIEVSARVRTLYGDTVLSTGFSGAPPAAGTGEWVLDLGRFSPGDYRVAITVTQGKKTVADRFWFRVAPMP